MSDLFNLLYEEYKEEYILNEGEIRTVNIGQTIYNLKNVFTFIKIIENKGNNTFIIYINEKIEVIDFEKLLQRLGNLGWYISQMLIRTERGSFKKQYSVDSVIDTIKNNNVYDIELTCEAKFDINVEKKPSLLYHLAPTRNVEKIMKIGLVPKSRSKLSIHPDRVYLGLTPESVRRLGRMFYNLGNERISNWTILKIYVDRIPDYLKLYQDPNYINRGVFTQNNIPPQSIEILEDIIV